MGSEMIQNTMVARAARLIAAKQEQKKKGVQDNIVPRDMCTVVYLFQLGPTS